MRRRRRSQRHENGLPRWLTDYNPADWPKNACHPECAYWEAVDQLRQEQPGVELPLSTMPDGAWHPETI